MTHIIATRESPFSLMYSTEAFIQFNITKNDNNDLKKEDILLIKEKGDNTLIRIEAKKRIVQKSYIRSMKRKNFSLRDWVLHKSLGNKVETTYGNFTTTWEGPY